MCRTAGLRQARILHSVPDLWSYLDALPPVAAPSGARAAVLVPLYPDTEGQMRVILTKRPDDMRTHPGDVVFPGGKIEDGEGPEDAAIREAWEEIRLEPSNVTVIGGLEPVTTRNRANLIVPVVARLDGPQELVADQTEVDVIIEPRVAELMDESRWRIQDFMGHELWFFEFAEGILWGATAFMMRDFLGYLSR